MEHTHTRQRARIYDYQTGEEIRKATIMEEWRYIAQLMSMTRNERTVGAVDGSEYDHDGSIYMRGGRVEIAASIPNVDFIRAGMLWFEFVGLQGANEFMLYSESGDIREAVEDYINTLSEVVLEDAPDDLADMLTAYIERDVRMAQLMRMGFDDLLVLCHRQK